MTTRLRVPFFVVLVVLVGAGTAGLVARQIVSQDVKIVTSGGEVAIGPGGVNLAAQPMGTGAGVIFGQVTEADSNRPVAGALVSISIPGAQPIRVMADAQGRFGFRDLPRGRFNIAAVRPGWVDGAYGRTRPGGPTLSVSLGDGEKVSGISVPMWRYASISGTVVDENGDAVVNKTVRAMRRTIQGGKLKLVPGPQDTTDDRGQFRIGMLEPGEYIVAVPMDAPFGGDLDAPLAAMAAKEVAVARATMASSGGGGNAMFSISLDPLGGSSLGTTEDGRPLNFPNMFYPSAPAAAKASVITLTTGEERTAIDFQLRPVPMSKITGTVMGPEGPSPNLQLTLVNAESEDLASPVDTLTGFTDNMGKFTISNVTPGQYILRAIRTPRAAMMPMETQTFTSGGNVAVFRTASVNLSAPLPTDPTLWAEMTVSVGARDITDLTVGLRAGSKVNGMVQFTGGAERPAGDKLPSIQLNLEPADSRPGVNNARGRVDQSGQFTTIGVPPGKYFIRVGGAPQGWTFQSAMVNGRDASVTPIDLEGNDLNGVIIAFTDRPSEFSGEVTVETGTPEMASVLVFPTDSAAWVGYGSQSRRFASARVGKDGKYRLMNLPAGEYYAIAIPDRLANDWQNPKVLETLAPGATRVRIRDNDVVTQSLKVAR